MRYCRRFWACSSTRHLHPSNTHSSKSLVPAADVSLLDLLYYTHVARRRTFVQSATKIETKKAPSVHPSIKLAFTRGRNDLPPPPLTPTGVVSTRVPLQRQAIQHGFGQRTRASSATMALPSLFLLLRAPCKLLLLLSFSALCPFVLPPPHTGTFLCLTYLLLATVLRARMGVQQASHPHGLIYFAPY